MSGGQVELPLVYFAGTGPSGSAAAQHSENPHAILMHLSGLKVAFPSTPADAKGLLIASIRDPNPVVFLLDLMLAGEKGPISEEPYETPLGSATVCREGVDVTVVALGSLVPKSLAVAEELEAEGVSVEVIDPRTLGSQNRPNRGGRSRTTDLRCRGGNRRSRRGALLGRSACPAEASDLGRRSRSVQSRPRRGDDGVARRHPARGAGGGRWRARCNSLCLSEKMFGCRCPATGARSQR